MVCCASCTILHIETGSVSDFRNRSTTSILSRYSALKPTFPKRCIGPDERLRRRDGFALTDARMADREILGEIHYCILCHERDKDTCSKGIRDATGKIAINPLDIPLAGCPLDEKISEMHYMRKNGDAIGAACTRDDQQPDVSRHGSSDL